MTEVGIGQPVWTSRQRRRSSSPRSTSNWRSYRARYHRLGTPVAEDVTLYEETEELGFSVGVGRRQDRSLIFIATGDNSTSEVRFVPADDPPAPLDAGLAAAGRSANIRSMRRTGGCGSSPTTSMSISGSPRPIPPRPANGRR